MIIKNLAYDFREKKCFSILKHYRLSTKSTLNTSGLNNFI